MKLNEDYPVIYKKINRFLKVRKIVIIIYLIGLIASVIVNLSVGGRMWSIYVLGGELITYYAFFDKPLIDNVLIKRIVLLFLIIFGYLYAIDKINSTHWSGFVIDILFFSLLIIELLFFFVHYNYHKNKIIIMLMTSIFSIAFCVFKAIRSINWAIIVTGSLGLFIILMLFTFYYKTTILEIKKYFSIK